MQGADSQLVTDLLADYGGRARRRMMAYLPDREPQTWLYGPMADYPRRGGRALRPTLCMATTRAFGGDPDHALLTAVSIELMHNAMLVHDDIADESDERRGQPALHHREGMALALNAGDALALFSMRPLVDNQRHLGPERAGRLLSETLRMARESAEGQAIDIGYRRDNVWDLTAADYLRMVRKKTSWLTVIHPCRTGALVAGVQSPGVLRALTRFGHLVGAAFQIQDDLLNLVGDHARYGKELGGDILEGKRTLMLLHLYEHSPTEERARLVELFGRPRTERSADDVTWVIDRMHQRGSITSARRAAHGLAGAARHEAERLVAHLPRTRERAFLLTLPRWVIERR